MHGITQIGFRSTTECGCRETPFSGIVALLLLSLAGFPGGGVAQETSATSSVIYQTGFEISEGYYDDTPLRGQGGWEGYGSGGNGLVTNFFEGYGQQAFIGFTPPAPKDDYLNVWRPTDFTPPAADPPIVKFSVLMQIVDSTNGEYDDFRWSVYNTTQVGSPAARLFTLDFDNSSAEIFYALDDSGAAFTSTGFRFSNNEIYELNIFMNFARNTWIATLNGLVVVDSQPITTIGSRLDLGDVDAVWAFRKKGAVGDNYMLFDDYMITAETVSSIPPVIEIVGRRQDGQFELLLHGERGLTYAVDVTSDFVTWETLRNVTLTTSGLYDFLDGTAADYPVSFYRVRQVAP